MLRYLTKSFILLIFVLSVASFSENIKDIDILANALSYSEDGTSVEAIGSVEVSAPDIKINADRIVCYLKDKRIVSSGDYEIKYKNGMRMSGNGLDYSLSTRAGDARNVRINVRNSVLTGANAKISEEKIELTDTTFDNCGLVEPHYHVSSYTTTLYPEDGWVIGYLGYLWVDRVPVVPVPVYVYDMSTSGTGKTTRAGDALAIPEVGSDDQDGAYVIERIPWIANKRISGRVVLFDTEYGGLGGGLEGNWTMDDVNDIYARVYYDKRYETYGGLTHTYKFGPKIGNDGNHLYTFFNIQKQLALELITNISVKEKINYQRVSMLPDVTLRLNEVPVITDNLKVGGEIGVGHVSEETSGVVDDRTRFALNSNYTMPTEIGTWYFGMKFSQIWYGKVDPWIRLNHYVKLSRGFDNGIDAYTAHLHYYYYNGLSPFLFEQYYTPPSDEMHFGLGYNFFAHRIALDYSYYVPDGAPKDLDYSMRIGFHCYNLDLKYRATRKEFSLGVSLVSI